jgi:Protein of unknown function (DUF3224)
MTTHIEGTFKLASWDENTYAELDGEAKLTRASIAQDFAGDLTGTGTSELLMHYREDGTATIVGLVHMAGTIGDRSGSFVLQSTGTYDGSEARSTWSVIPGSGTGQLRGLRGDGVSVAPGGPSGTYTLDYDLD